MNRSTISPAWIARPSNAAAALFLLSYPTVTLVVHGGASALQLAATFVSLIALALPDDSQTPGVDRITIATCVALASPLAATLISELWYGNLVFSLLDAPSRFVAAVPILLAMRRVPAKILRWSDLSFAIGAIAGCLVLLITQRAEDDRLAGPFLDAIHFGDIALVLGALSALSLNWWRKDAVPVRLVKIVGLLAGLYASALTGTRGGWLAIPAIALIVYLRKKKSAGRRVLIPLAVFAAIVVVGASSAAVRDRVLLVWSDLVQYTHGYKDTSTGVRLQLYEAALMLMREHLVFGVGPNGFADSMHALASAGRLTPLAAAFGRGETHNQMLFYAANYGLIGGLAGIALHLVPCLMFGKYLRASTSQVRGAALMGLTFVVSFWIFGLSVETFDLKMVASFYAAVIGILGGIATSPALAPAAERGANPSISGTQSSCSAS
ncbi:O-antigen ligase family protein [Trinickia sp. EG282A]|uniref:O-antigen ligase family protein n=1 Tax=Trinickia sp. EG282A TaxID=3237013 RepID=UPI0034D1A31A